MKKKGERPRSRAMKEKQKNVDHDSEIISTKEPGKMETKNSIGMNFLEGIHSIKGEGVGDDVEKEVMKSKKWLILSVLDDPPLPVKPPDSGDHIVVSVTWREK